MNKNILCIGCALLLLAGCASKKTGNNSTEKAKSTAGTIAAEKGEYKGMYPRQTDLIHTSLEISFNWDSSFAYGKATLSCKPWFYPSDQLILDAKTFKINRVALQKAGKKTDLKYTYDTKKLIIQLDKTYTKDEEYKVFIDYTAMPDKRPEGGSAAISSDKGLYFINPLSAEPNKPRQIWTQGETESNSFWMPTIDGTQEKMTQDIAITVDNKYTTLSNGLLAYSTVNPDGTRTDKWKQDLPHSTYLTMMAIGEFEITQDRWRDMEVSYYMEPKYAPYAKLIFGNTPEMIEFFSNKLGVEYPWDKYSQVVVRDFVAGAMENTSATVCFESMNLTDREYLDNTYEDVISHELFHHWFGDLVTAESWANLTLNESFATYGEYLWKENKYGRDAADEVAYFNLQSYLGNPENASKDLVRFHYNKPDDLFDAISYAKGGNILHMLRKYVGDEAFFESLKLYLERNRFKTAEIHDLRLAFEEISGQDLNWFFNQWFLASGHPELELSYRYDDADKKVYVSIEQKQDLSTTPLYQLPLEVDIYVNGKKERKQLTVTKQKEEFAFDAAVKPELVNVDAEKMLVGTKKDNKSKEEWAFQYTVAPLFLDRFEALEASMSTFKNEAIVLKALNDPYYLIRERAVSLVKDLSAENKAIAFTQLESLAKTDPKSDVRSAAIYAIAEQYADKENTSLFKQALADKSYRVMTAALDGMAKTNATEAMKVAAENENTENTSLRNGIARLYAAEGKAPQLEFFEKALAPLKGFKSYYLLQQYKTFLIRVDAKTAKEGIPVLSKAYTNNSQELVKEGIKGMLLEIQKAYAEKEKQAKGNEAGLSAVAEVQAAIQTALNGMGG